MLLRSSPCDAETLLHTAGLAPHTDQTFTVKLLASLIISEPAAVSFECSPPADQGAQGPHRRTWPCPTTPCRPSARTWAEPATHFSCACMYNWQFRTGQCLLSGVGSQSTLTKSARDAAVPWAQTNEASLVLPASCYIDQLRCRGLLYLTECSWPASAIALPTTENSKVRRSAHSVA